MYDMMLGKRRRSKVCVPSERYPKYLTQDAVSMLRNLLNKDPSRRLGARRDTRSILMHPFFRTVNWDAVLQKRVTPPVKPVTLKFLTVDPDAPGDAHDLGRNPSIENAHRGAIQEQPPVQSLIAKRPTTDSGERADTDESRSISPFNFTSEGDADESWSSSSYKTANDGSVLEGPTH